MDDIKQRLDKIISILEQLQKRESEKEAILKWLRSHPPIRYGEPDPMSTREIAYRIERGDFWQIAKN